jgi:hypothetical protein
MCQVVHFVGRKRSDINLLQNVIGPAVLNAKAPAAQVNRAKDLLAAEGEGGLVAFSARVGVAMGRHGLGEGEDCVGAGKREGGPGEEDIGPECDGAAGEEEGAAAADTRLAPGGQRQEGCWEGGLTSTGLSLTPPYLRQRRPGRWPG